MAQTTSRPDLSLCFGRHQSQPVTYALQHCLSCPKLKPCVRTTWGVDRPRRLRRDSWQPEDQERTTNRSPWPTARESVAT